MAIDREEFKKVLVESGLSWSKTAKHFGFTRQYAQQHARELGLEVRKSLVDRTAKHGKRSKP